MGKRQYANVDAVIGERLRRRRVQIRMSQDTLARALGVTFQQIQKYESGSNRISVSTLLHAARALGASPSYFYEGIVSDGGPTAEVDPASRFLATREGLDVVSAVTRMPTEVRRSFIDLARRVAEEDRTRTA